MYKLRSTKKQWARNPNAISKTFCLWRRDKDETQVGIRLCTFTRSGKTCVFTDEMDELHEFNLESSVYKHIFNVGSVSCLVAGINRDSEVLIGLTDGTLKCIDVRMQKMVGICVLLDDTVLSISPAENRMEALVCGKNCAVIVKLDTFEAVHKLQVVDGMTFVDAFFLPSSVTAVFQDGSMNAWVEGEEMMESDKVPQDFVCCTSTVIGSHIILAGRASHSFIYDLETLRFTGLLQLPGCGDGIVKLDCVRVGLPSALSAASEFIVFDHVTSSLLFSSRGDAIVDDFSVGSRNIALLEKGKLLLIETESFFEKSKQLRIPSETKQTVSTLAPKSHSFKIPPKIDTARLLQILEEFMEYPAKYRTCIWHMLLSLPLNFDAFSAILKRGLHPSFSSLETRFRFEDRRLTHNFKIVLSTLSHWCGILAEWNAFPSFCFPFVKSFQMRPMLCFEILATVFLNWGGRWFELFPSPPVNFLAMVENLICHYDAKLVDHFTHCKVSSEVYAWNPVKAALSEIFVTDDWFVVWDHIFSNPPSFLPCLLAAYSLVNRVAILSCKTDADLQLYFRTRNPVILKEVIKKANQLMESAPDSIHPKHHTDDFVPLPTGQYPAFTKFPKAIIAFKAAERQRIAEREKELEKEKERTQQLDQEIERLKMNEKLTRARMQMIHATELSREMEIRNADEEQDRIEQEFRKLSLYMSKKEEQLFQATQNKILMENSAKLSDRVVQLEYILREKKKKDESQQQTALAQLEKSCRELNAKKRMLELQLENLVPELSSSSSSGTTSRTEQLDEWRRVMTNLDHLKTDVNYDLLSAAVKEGDHIRTVKDQQEIATVCEKIRSIETDMKELMAKLTKVKSKDLEEKIRILQSIKAKHVPQTHMQETNTDPLHESPLSIREKIASKYL